MEFLFCICIILYYRYRISNGVALSFFPSSFTICVIRCSHFFDFSSFVGNVNVWWIDAGGGLKDIPLKWMIPCIRNVYVIYATHQKLSDLTNVPLCNHTHIHNTMCLCVCFNNVMAGKYHRHSKLYVQHTHFTH